MATNKADGQTLSNIDRFLSKISQKFPETEEPVIMTDIHLTVSPDSGELMAFDDNDDEITRCVIEEWINNNDEHFYDNAAAILRERLRKTHAVVDSIGILKPFSFILETDEHEHFSELYLVDSDMEIIGGDLMQGLDEELDKFFDELISQ